MGRKRLYSKQEFMKARRKAKSIQKLASMLHIAVCTTYVYMIRYRVKPYSLSGNKGLDPIKLGAMYKFNVTIDDIARKLRVSWSAVHHCLRKLVLYPNKYSLTSKTNKGKDYLPPPKTIPEIKIVLLVKQHPKYIDDPWPMVSLPGITENLIDSYYRHAFGYGLEEYEKGEE